MCLLYMCRPECRLVVLVERMTQTVLEALEDRAVPAIPDKSETPKVWMASPIQRLPSEIERLNDEYATNEPMDTSTRSNSILAMIQQKLKQKI